MRVAFVGVGETTRRTASLLVDRGHEVIVVDSSREALDRIAGQVDCGRVEGDGSSPAILQELDPENLDVLFSLSPDDRVNILASLVARSLGVGRVVLQVEDTQLVSVCQELGLSEVIVPSSTIGRYLADFVGGEDVVELSTVIKGEARFLTFEVGEEDRGAASDLELPEEAAAICLYRNEEFHLIGEDTELQRGDEVVLLTHSRNLATLRERWDPVEGRAD